MPRLAAHALGVSGAGLATFGGVATHEAPAEVGEYLVDSGWLTTLPMEPDSLQFGTVR